MDRVIATTPGAKRPPPAPKQIRGPEDIDRDKVADDLRFTFAAMGGRVATPEEAARARAAHLEQTT